MQVIIDASVLFAALLTHGPTAWHLFSEEVEPFAPALLFEEIEEHKERILSRTKRTEAGLRKAMKAVKRRIKIIPEAEFLNYLEDAKKLLADKDDAAYLAACLATGLPLWSNDAGFKRQRRVTVYTTKELAGCLGLE